MRDLELDLTEQSEAELQRMDALRKMGFLEDPFTMSADPRYLYYSSQHSAIMDQIKNLIANRRGIGVIEGAMGTGKSSMSKRIFDLYSAKKSYSIVYLLDASFETESVAVQTICENLNLPKRKSTTDKYTEIQKFLNREYMDRKVVILIIDDAQTMTTGAMKVIFKLYNYDNEKKLIQVVLFGQPDIQDVFNRSLETRDRVYSWNVLNPLTLTETTDLIDYRCVTAGRKTPLFTATSLYNIFNSSFGIPRNIVRICGEATDIIIESGNTIGLTNVPDSIVEQAIERAKRVYKMGDNNVGR